MNSDRCYHIPTSPGQSMCTCKDYAMTLEMIIAVQAEFIVKLTKRFEKGEVKLIINK